MRKIQGHDLSFYSLPGMPDNNDPAIWNPDANAIGEMVDLVYIGDHYRLLVRTDDEEDFVLNTPYSYNIHDRVGIHVKSGDIRLRLKKEVTEYEI